jgi:hypothetical protein
VGGLREPNIQCASPTDGFQTPGNSPSDGLSSSVVVRSGFRAWKTLTDGRPRESCLALGRTLGNQHVEKGFGTSSEHVGEPS